MLEAQSIRQQGLTSIDFVFETLVDTYTLIMDDLDEINNKLSRFSQCNWSQTRSLLLTLH